MTDLPLNPPEAELGTCLNGGLTDFKPPKWATLINETKFFINCSPPHWVVWGGEKEINLTVYVSLTT